MYGINLMVIVSCAYVSFLVPVLFGGRLLLPLLVVGAFVLSGGDSTSDEDPALESPVEEVACDGPMESIVDGEGIEVIDGQFGYTLSL